MATLTVFPASSPENSPGRGSLMELPFLHANPVPSFPAQDAPAHREPGPIKSARNPVEQATDSECSVKPERRHLESRF
jgi:hypothetical protein